MNKVTNGLLKKQICKKKFKTLILSKFFCLYHRDINTRDERKSNGGENG